MTNTQKFVWGALLALSTTACAGGSNPTAPSASTPQAPAAPTTATLQVSLDLASCFNVAEATVYIDGLAVNTLPIIPGFNVSKTVSIGAHTVEGRGVSKFLPPAFVQTPVVWAPQTVDVTAGGASRVLTCAGSRGYDTVPPSAPVVTSPAPTPTPAPPAEVVAPQAPPAPAPAPPAAVAPVATVTPDPVPAFCPVGEVPTPALQGHGVICVPPAPAAPALSCTPPLVATLDETHNREPYCALPPDQTQRP